MGFMRGRQLGAGGFEGGGVVLSWPDQHVTWRGKGLRRIRWR
jgi:hypothetical protein